jgi:hypothetical protein
LNAVCRDARAAAITYSSKSAFLSGAPAGIYLEKDFPGYPAFSPQTSLSFSGGTPAASYTITAPTAGVAVFPDAGFAAVGNWNSSQDIVVAFGSGNVRWAGADFWLSDINGVRKAGDVNVSFSVGAATYSGLVPSAVSGPFGFFGIDAGAETVSSLTIAADGDLYLNLTNLYAGAVPEPSTLGMAAAGCSLLGSFCGRRRRTATTC